MYEVLQGLEKARETPRKVITCKRRQHGACNIGKMTAHPGMPVSRCRSSARIKQTTKRLHTNAMRYHYQSEGSVVCVSSLTASLAHGVAFASFITCMSLGNASLCEQVFVQPKEQIYRIEHVDLPTQSFKVFIRSSRLNSPADECKKLRTTKVPSSAS